LTFHRRLLTLWAWLMVFPNCGPLPQISQTRAINSEILPGLLPKLLFYRNPADFAKAANALVVGHFEIVSGVGIY